MFQIECQNLVLGYEGKIVLSEVSFNVSAGDYLCIIGENGSGKSTLMRALLKLKDPVGGKIKINSLASEIGYLPQQTVVQKDFPASVREVVRSGCLNRCGLWPFYKKEEKQCADESMLRLGISELATRCYRELSGGQQQRTLLARALCATSQVLLLDEPVAGLDPKATVDMYELISELNQGGITIIMISHDIGVAINYASHILHVGDGFVKFFGSKDEYLAGGVVNA